MSRNQVSSGEVVSQLLKQSDSLIDTITNDEELQIRAVHDSDSGSRGSFEDSIENSMGEIGGVQDVDFIEVESDYVAVISL